MQISTIGLDTAKNAFQIHGVDAKGHAAICEAYTTLTAFILSKSGEISIFAKYSQESINVQKCNVIPRLPDKRGPDCSEAAKNPTPF
jgi:hypothetical protein